MRDIHWLSSNLYSTIQLTVEHIHVTFDGKAISVIFKKK